MSKLSVPVFLAASLALASVPAQAAPNLLVNGGFEASTSSVTTPPGWFNVGPHGRRHSV